MKRGTDTNSVERASAPGVAAAVPAASEVASRRRFFSEEERQSGAAVGNGRDGLPALRSSRRRVLGVPASSDESTEGRQAIPTRSKPTAQGKGRSPGRKRESKPAQLSQEELQEQLLAQIAYAASHCAEIERAFGENPPPQTETLMNIYRVLILKLSGEAQVNPDQLRLAMSLLKPVLDWERFEDVRKERAQAEQKERDAQAAARSREAGDDALSPETLEQIERELSLL